MTKKNKPIDLEDVAKHIGLENVEVLHEWIDVENEEIVCEEKDENGEIVLKRYSQEEYNNKQYD